MPPALPLHPVNPDNACTIRITAAAGTYLAGASYSGTVISSSLLIGLYIPKYFFAHAASLHQGFPHCAISPTAASRRSLGRVSVPMWPSALSGRLLIVALVGRCPANKLIRRGPLPYRRSFPHKGMRLPGLCGISSRFRLLSPCMGQVAHALLTRPPLSHPGARPEGLLPACFVRLACVRHAASVHPEPGSNSHVVVSQLPGSLPVTVFWMQLLLLLFFLNFSLGFFKVIPLFSCLCAFCCTACLSRGQLRYNIMYSSVCQELFLLFLTLYLAVSGEGGI